jgi:hypothetical protein
MKKAVGSAQDDDWSRGASLVPGSNGSPTKARGSVVHVGRASILLISLLSIPHPIYEQSERNPQTSSGVAAPYGDGAYLRG